MEASRDSKARVQFFASFGYYNNTRFRHKDLNYCHSALKYSKILKAQHFHQSFHRAAVQKFWIFGIPASVQ